MKPKRLETQHRGLERYEVTLEYSEDDLRYINRITPVGEILVDTVVVVWTRRLGGTWRREAQARTGSRAIGRRKTAQGLRQARSAKEVFLHPTGEMRPWVDRLPGLRNEIEAVEDSLPEQYMSTPANSSTGPYCR